MKIKNMLLTGFATAAALAAVAPVASADTGTGQTPQKAGAATATADLFGQAHHDLGLDRIGDHGNVETLKASPLTVGVADGIEESPETVSALAGPVDGLSGTGELVLPTGS
ncbi:hypothetical protein [Streptomyces sp. NPDC096339]|uniref:hypothetical protein n=1 Tax=Streptomyces sp. NPDC096339 TaxID=3366086 RepID=UPI0037FF2DC8